MNKIKKITSRVVPLLIDNIDTDQIIPARFLKTTSKAGLGDNLFADWRFDRGGNPLPDFILNHPDVPGSKILITGENFGCGSSREHAPWALKDFGFSAIIALSFADIFRSNAIKNGILPVTLPDKDWQILVDTMQEIPGLEIEMDIEGQAIILPTGVEVSFEIEPFAKMAITEGLDELEYLVANLPKIRAYERRAEAFIQVGGK